MSEVDVPESMVEMLTPEAKQRKIKPKTIPRGMEIRSGESRGGMSHDTVGGDQGGMKVTPDQDKSKIGNT
jgi:hypothetical protein